MTVLRVAACAAALAFLGDVRTTSAAYTFTNIYSGPSSTTIILGYDISGSTVAIQGGDGIFKVTGGVTTSIVTAGDAAPVGTFSQGSFGTLPKVGVSGATVSFKASYAGGTAIFTGTGGPLTTIAKIGDATSDGAITSFPVTDRSSISGANIVFLATTAAGDGVYVGTGGLATTIVNAGDPAPTGTFTSINAAAGSEAMGPVVSGDRAAFIGAYSGGQGVFTGNGGTLTTIVKTGDPAPSGNFLQGSLTQHMISGEAVAFRANYTGGTGVFVGNGGPLTTIAKSGDPAPGGAFQAFAIGGVANNGADVSFVANWTGGVGAFVSKSGVLETVIKTGDLLFGQTVTGLHATTSPTYSVARLDPTGSGNVAFSYRLADGTIGVALATPVPEPAALALAATTLALVIRRRRAH